MYLMRTHASAVYCIIYDEDYFIQPCDSIIHDIYFIHSNLNCSINNSTLNTISSVHEILTLFYN